ncbi:MAG: potassium/proton antiporter [Bacteroidales bacterium]|nr:potassium/proton antiporter [Bacteroidales bacterium]
MTTLFLILVGVVVLLCIGLNSISSRIGVPALLAFILLGILFGNSGLIPLQFDDHTAAKEICSIALIFIMFYGGFGTRWKSARPIVAEASLLASLGVVLTAAFTGIFCHYAFRWDWTESLLIGAVVGSTDAASVFSILRSKKLGLKNNTAPILEMESGSNDPMAHMLTLLMLSVLKGTATAGSIAWMLFAQIAFGLGCGFFIAILAATFLEKVHIKDKGYDSLFFVATALLAYAIPEIIGGNGYLSVYIVGVYLGNREFPGRKALVNFFDGITGFAQVIIFFLLGLLARPAELHKVIIPALAIFVFMLLVARPLSVMSILTPFRKYPFRQQALVSFVGLRGAASIVFAIVATSDTVSPTHDIFNIVFCLVLISISLQGSLIPFVSKKLKMVDATVDVMKTFNDYSEQKELQAGSIDIVPGGSWDGKRVMDLDLPKNMMLALVLRGEERIIAKGDTVLQAGDKVVIVTKTFDEKEIFLIEKKVKKNGRRAGHAIKDVSGEGLVLLVRRDDEDFIPDGDTVLLEGDILVLLRHEKTTA